MQVTAVNAVTNTFTVVRGANGTAAAAHTAGDDVGAPLRVDAVDTWVKDSTAPTADIIDVDPDPRILNGGIVRVRFSEPVTGLGGSADNAFTLTLDLLDGSDIQTVNLAGVNVLPVDGQNIGGNIFAREWELDLSAVTTTTGLYALSLRPTGAIVDQAGNVFGGHDIAGVSNLGVDPIVITAPNHGLVTGNRVTITGVEGNTAANGTFTVTVIDANTFSLDGSVSNGDYTGGGQWRRTETITNVTGDGLGPIQITSPNHGLSTGDRVVITGVGGNTAANGVFSVTVLDADTFVLDRTTGNGNYTGGGEWAPVDVVDTFRVVPLPPQAQIFDARNPGNPLELDATEIFTVDTTPPEAIPFTVTSPRNSAVGIVTVNFTEDVIRVDLGDFVLRRNGANVPLAGLPFTQISPSQYIIDLNIVTGAPGDYDLFLNGATSLIEDLAGNPIQAALIPLASWTTDIVAPSADIDDITPDPRNTEAGIVTINFTKDVTGVDISDFQLTRDGAVLFDKNNQWPGLAVNQVTPKQYTIDLSGAGLTDQPGTYELRLVAFGSGIEDAAGNPLQVDAVDTWVNDNTAPTVDIVDIYPDPRADAVGLVNILFDEPVLGVDIADFTLTRDGTPIDLAAAGLTVTQETPVRFTIDLTTVTDQNGTYVLTLTAAGSGITDLAGNALVLDAQDEWFRGIDIVNPVADIVDIAPDPQQGGNAGWVQINFNEDVTGVDLSDFTLTRNGTPIDLAAAGVTVTNLPGSASQYQIDLSNVTGVDGTYVLTLVAAGSGIQDLAGNPLVADAVDDWVRDTPSPTVTITDITPDPRMRPVGVVTVTFDVGVQGVDRSDFELTRDGRPISLGTVPFTQLTDAVYTLDLTSVTGADGTYTFRIVPEDSGITSIATGDPLLSDDSVSWTMVHAITVDSAEDSVDVNPGDGVVADSLGRKTLRAAIMEANALPGDDTIILPAGVYTFALAGTGEDFAATGDLDIRDATGSLTIVGAGADTTIIDAAGLDRVFHILAGATLNLQGVTVRGGRVTGSNDGGGLSNLGTTTVTDAVITGNTSADDGGGLNNAGILTLTRTTVSDNTATNTGGGIRNTGVLTIVDSTIGGYDDGAGNDTRNVAGQNGGGLINTAGGTTTVWNSTFSGNVSTFGSGGAIRVDSGSVELRNTTIAQNTAFGFGGGVMRNGGTVTLGNTIVADNTATTGGPDYFGAFTSLGYNLFGNTSGGIGFDPTDLQNQNALLGPLADNGGPTLTHALGLGSPAIDAGNNANVPAGTGDQRGSTRILDGPDGDSTATVDIGAVEFGGFFVNQTDDRPDATPLGDGVVDVDPWAPGNQITLRAAMEEANALAGDNTIVLPDGTFTLTRNAPETVPPTADIIDVVPDPRFDPVGLVTIEFSEQVLGFDLNDLSLTLDDGLGPVAIPLAGAPFEQISATQYTVDLSLITDTDGLYTLTLTAAGSGITDLEGNALVDDAVETWIIGDDLFPPTGDIVDVTPDPRSTDAGVVTVNFSEDVTGVDLGDFDLTRTVAITSVSDLGVDPIRITSPGHGLTTGDTVTVSGVTGNSAANGIWTITVIDADTFSLDGSVSNGDYTGGGQWTQTIDLLAAGVAVVQVTPSQYTLDLSGVTASDGDYTLSLLTTDALTPIQDAMGNLLAAGDVDTWTKAPDTFAPTADIVDVLPDPRVTQVGLVTITFDEDVTGVDIADFTLTFDDGQGGGPQPIDISAAALVQVSPSEYTVDLTNFTDRDGTYVLTLVAAGSGIQDLAGNALAADASDTWVKGEDLSNIGDLDVYDTTGALNLIGAGASASIIDAGGAAGMMDRVLDVRPNATLNVMGVTIQGGFVVGPEDGGGIRNQGTLSVTNSALANNTTPANGGGIFSNTTVTLTATDFSDNSADFGGGLFNDQNGTVAITGGLFTNNTAATDGGAIYNDRSGTIDLANANLSGNTAGRDGGGLYLNDVSVATVDNVRLESNVATRNGGGIFNEQAAQLTLTNSALATNQAVNGGGLYNEDGAVTVDNTSFSANRTTGNGAGVFVTSNGTVTFTDVTLSGNIADGSGGAIENAGTVSLTDSRVVDNQAGVDGGGIRTSRSLTLTSTSVSGNQAAQDGGGIRSGGAGAVTITRSTIADNTAGHDGGGLFNTDAAVATVDQTTIRDNTAGNDGGGVVHRSTSAFTLTASTVSGNAAEQNGGGVLNGGAMTLLNSTVSGNEAAADGGGLFNEGGGTLTVTLSTITANTAAYGGGIRNASLFTPVNLGNTIVAGNTATTSGPDLSAVDTTRLVSLGHNLIGDNTDVAAAFPAGDPNANADIVGTGTNPRTPRIRCWMLSMTMAARPGHTPCCSAARLATRATTSACRRPISEASDASSTGMGMAWP